MKKFGFIVIVFLLGLWSCNSNKIQNHTLHVVTTGDVHGSWFDEDYENQDVIHPSLLSASKKVNDLRDSVGADNVLLLDAGDCLQGNVAPYYYNYVKVGSRHLFADLASYMKYDAVVVGNHDIETSHLVYDRVRRNMDEVGVPWLAGNVINKNGDIYFQEYTVVERAGLKILVMGYTNPNIPKWLQEEKWSDLTFKGLLPYVQERVDAVKAAVNPQLTIVVVHSGTGNGDGKMYENQGLDLFESLKGVDLLVTGHDHVPVNMDHVDGIHYLNAGSKAVNVGHAVINVVTKGNNVMGVDVVSSVEKLDVKDVDTVMKANFHYAFEEVKAFTTNTIGGLNHDIKTREGYVGMSFCNDLVSRVMLETSGAQIAFCAPLTYNGVVPAGAFRYSDLRTIYPFENEMVVVRMTGNEIIGFLEFSYDKWINTISENDINDDTHLLKIVEKDDPRTGSKNWSFVNRSYNFESAAGLNYNVDVTKTYGNRVIVKSLADGTEFDPEKSYNVVMTSYRFSGAGDMLEAGAGINREEAAKRLVAKYGEIRDLIQDYVVSNKDIDYEMISDRRILGTWRFVPYNIIAPLIKKDTNLLFSEDD